MYVTNGMTRLGRGRLGPRGEPNSPNRFARTSVKEDAGDLGPPVWVAREGDTRS
jgi:hypothetical protein